MRLLCCPLKEIWVVIGSDAGDLPHNLVVVGKQAVGGDERQDWAFVARCMI